MRCLEMQQEHGQTWSLYGGNCLINTFWLRCIFVHFCLSKLLCKCLHFVYETVLCIFADIIVDSHWIATYITSKYETFYSVASSKWSRRLRSYVDSDVMARLVLSLALTTATPYSPSYQRRRWHHCNEYRMRLHCWYWVSADEHTSRLRWSDCTGCRHWCIAVYIAAVLRIWWTSSHLMTVIQQYVVSDRRQHVPL